jgi:uncharacterized protein YbjT (DUF2867 family)
MEAIHAMAPIALFDACRAEGIRRVVQISAISADTEVGTPYALTKKRADDHLRSLPLDWTVLRPSLVYGSGSYGGTSTLRGLAGLPLVTPLVGDGSQPFRPLHVDDLVEAVGRALEVDRFAQRTLEPVGPQRLTVREIVALYRRWLGLPPAWQVCVPIPLMRLFGRLADVAGGGPMGSAGLAQLLAGNAGHEAQGAFSMDIGFEPAAMEVRLARTPSETQDLWHARLYFVRPLLRITLAWLWLGSGVAGLMAPPALYARIASPAAAFAFSILDLLIGFSLLVRWRPQLMAIVQALLVIGYTVGIGVIQPALWLDPFGALLKNLPILAAIGVWAVLERER